MSEFRFPTPKTDVISEVRVGPKLSPDSPDSGKQVLQKLGIPSEPSFLLPAIGLQKMLNAPKFSYRETIAFGDDRGMLYRPILILYPQDVRGLVIMAHGELTLGYDTPYQYAMDDVGYFLAGFGFVCISIKPRPLAGGNNVVEGYSHTYLRHLKNATEHIEFVKDKPVAFIGHSQAGRGAVQAGQMIQGGHVDGFSKLVDAIVGFAATPVSVMGLNPSRSYLGMQGSSDGDSNLPDPRSVCAYEEVSGCLERYFLWLFGCNHRQFVRQNPVKDYYVDPYPTSAGYVMRAAAQTMVVRQFTVMFLLWKLCGMSEYRPVFRGEKYVDFYSSNDATMEDLKKGLRVLPRYDRWRPMSLGWLPGAAKFQGMLQNGGEPISNSNPAEFGHLKDLETTCRCQLVRGFVVEWDHGWSKIPRIELECRSDVVSRPDIKAIEFSAVFISDPEEKGDLQSVGASAYMWYIDTLDKKPHKSSVVQIFIEPPSWGPTRNSVVSTVRIPIELFKLGSALKNATKFVVDLSKSTRTKGRIAISGFYVAFT